MAKPRTAKRKTRRATKSFKRLPRLKLAITCIKGHALGSPLDVNQIYQISLDYAHGTKKEQKVIMSPNNVNSNFHDNTSSGEILDIGLTSEEMLRMPRGEVRSPSSAISICIVVHVIAKVSQRSSSLSSASLS